MRTVIAITKMIMPMMISSFFSLLFGFVFSMTMLITVSRSQGFVCYSVPKGYADIVARYNADLNLSGT